MKRLFYIVIIALAAAGCGRPARLSPQLVDVEAALESDADSALRLLAAIDSASLRSDVDRAAYVLFGTMARDKAYLDIAADTAIFAASDCFRRSSLPRYEMLADCYGSRVRFERREFAKSVLLAMKARELAGRLSLPFYEGLASRNIRDAYNDCHYYRDGLKYSLDAYEKFSEAGAAAYVNNAMYDLADNMIADGCGEKSFSWISRTKDSALVAEDSVLVVDSDRLLAKAYFALREDDKAEPLYRRLLEAGQGQRVDSLYLANIYIRQGRPELAKNLIFTGTPDSDYLETAMRFRYYEKTGDKDSIIASMREYLQKTIAVMDLHTESEIPGVISDYFFLEQQINRERERANRLETLVVGIVLLVLLVCVIVVAGIVIVRNRRKLERNVALALQIQEELSNLTRRHDEYSSKAQSLFSTRYTLLDQLSQIVYESASSTAARRRISETVSELIAELGREDSPKNRELASFVDDAFNNLYSRFKTDFPDLRQVEYNLFVYSVLGFSASTISIFLGEKTISTLYERKRRLRNKVKLSSVPSKAEYLSHLGQRAVN